MTLRGIVQSAELLQGEDGGDSVEMSVRAQGVGPGQPRRFIVPYELLLADESLDPDLIQGRAFQAEVEESEPARWVASAITLASRVLRSQE